MFGEDLELPPLLSIKTAQIQKWYDLQVKRIKVVTVNAYEWVTPHIMWHTFASLLAIKRVSLYKIATWLGDTLETTQKHYAHLAPTDSDIEHLNGCSKSKAAKKKK